MIETKFKDAILFVPVCANCGVAIVNRDQIEAGQKVVLRHIQESVSENNKYLSTRSDRYAISPGHCPRCHTMFDKIVVPYKAEDAE